MKNRLERERETVEVMIKYFCKKVHGSEETCSECSELISYAFKRISCCKFGVDKPVCGSCKIHCYNKNMREKIREVMRFSGPRMIFINPVLAVEHVIHKIK